MAWRSEDADREWVFLGRDGQVLLTLWRQAEGSFTATQPGLHHLALRVDSVEELHAVDAPPQRDLRRPAQPVLDDLLDALEGQVSGPVNWMANMHALAPRADRILEVGPGRPLRGFFKSLGIEITSIVSCKTAEKAIAA